MLAHVQHTECNVCGSFVAGGQQAASAASQAALSQQQTTQATEQTPGEDPGTVEKYPDPPAKCHTLEYSE